MKKIMLQLGNLTAIIFMVFFVSLAFMPVFATAEESGDFSLTVNVPVFLSATASDVNITASPNIFTSGNTLFTAETNNRTGFTSTITMLKNSTETNAKDLKHTITEDKIEPLTTEVIKEAFPTNFWGFSLNNTNFSGIPARDESPTTIFISNAPTTGFSQAIYFGVKMDGSKATGVYTSEVLITTIANYAPDGPTLKSVTYMQEVTNEICANTDVATVTSGQYKLVDSRDNKEYYVAKLADGKCWMTQDLDLDLDTNTILTNNDTDLNSVDSWTPERSTIAKNNLSTSTWVSDNNNPYSYDPGEIYTSSGYPSFSACIAAGRTEDVCRHHHFGNSYNWTSAIASNDSSSIINQYQDAPDSICPKNWRLWRANHSENESGEMSNLAYNYNLFENQIITSNGYQYWATGGFDSFTLAPIFMSDYTTCVRNGSTGSCGSDNYYWSSTVSSSTSAIILSFNRSYIKPQQVYMRNYGLVVRCVADEPKFYSIVYNMNTSSMVSDFPSDISGTTHLNTINISTLTPIRADYQFVGWGTSDSATVASYQPGDIIDITTNAINTLYAIWKRPNAFDTAFAAAGKAKQDGYYIMQDMTPEICANVPTPTDTIINTSTQLKDTRDGKVYWVSKLKDGKCWMTQNLDLNLSTSTTLTSANTDLNSTPTWTPSQNTVTELADYEQKLSYDPGDIYYYTSKSGADDTMYSSLSACVEAEHSMDECTHYHAGNYYNFSAATATNNIYSTMATPYQNATDSICPKGWRLPATYLSGAKIKGDVENLMEVYNIEKTTSGSVFVRNEPLFFVRSGMLTGGHTLNYFKSDGYYWSSTMHSVNEANIHGFSSGTVYSSVYLARPSGLSIRCVVRETQSEPEPPIATITYMQEMTSDICSNTPTPFTCTNCANNKTNFQNIHHYELIDGRDNKTYTVAKLADGNCWMTQNLDLDLSDSVSLTNADTDLNTIVSWTPERSTIVSDSLNESTWTNSGARPYSYDPGDLYYFVDNRDLNEITYPSLSACVSAEHEMDECKHYHVGNYYNWTAATASNDSSSITTNKQNAPNSICPKGWMLPIEGGNNRKYSFMVDNNFTTLTSKYRYIRATPVFMTRTGYVGWGEINNASTQGYYFSSTTRSSSYAYGLNLSANTEAIDDFSRSYGASIRCIADFSVATSNYIPPQGKINYYEDDSSWRTAMNIALGVTAATSASLFFIIVSKHKKDDPEEVIDIS